MNGRQPDTSRLQEQLNLKAAWHPRTKGDATLAPSAQVIRTRRSYRRSPAGHLYGTAWHALTFTRWALRRGPRCGDRYCWDPECWPGGKVLLP